VLVTEAVAVVVVALVVALPSSDAPLSRPVS
jgi:hypothetical protein